MTGDPTCPPRQRMIGRYVYSLVRSEGPTALRCRRPGLRPVPEAVPGESDSALASLVKMRHVRTEETLQAPNVRLSDMESQANSSRS